MSRTRPSKVIRTTVQSITLPLATLAGTLSSPWLGLIASGAGLLAIYGDLAYEEGKEIIEYVNLNKDKFVDSIINSPEFTKVFLNVWEMHIRETSETKRIRL